MQKRQDQTFNINTPQGTPADWQMAQLLHVQVSQVLLKVLHFVSTIRANSYSLRTGSSNTVTTERYTRQEVAVYIQHDRIVREQIHL